MRDWGGAAGAVEGLEGGGRGRERGRGWGFGLRIGSEGRWKGGCGLGGYG